LTTVAGVERFSETHWKSLRYFSLYRCALRRFFSSPRCCTRQLFPYRSRIRVCRIWPWPAYTWRVPYWRLSWLIVIASMLQHAVDRKRAGRRGGDDSADSCRRWPGQRFWFDAVGDVGWRWLVGQGRLVLFYAAMATLSILFEQSYRALQHEFDAAGFFHAGLFSAGFFAVAICALLARRVIANEALARQRGIDLNNQTLISQRVIEEMQDGVLVLSRDGRVRQSNPRARQLLGSNGSSEVLLPEYSPELARGFARLVSDGSEDAMLVQVAANHAVARAVCWTASTERDVLVFLENMSRLREQAQQIKLAALGRLTASIAHEIRNPLSAISHAGELMREERRGELYERLLRIVLDNSQRLERIVSDVLELGRRDRVYRELIDLREMLPSFVEQYLVKENVPADVIRLELSGLATLCFDRSHFHQVLWNLLSNALRHSQVLAGSVRMLVFDAQGRWSGGTACDRRWRGCGRRVAGTDLRALLHHTPSGYWSGSLYCRELCDANGAQLELQSPGPGADFRVLGRAVGC
jgi:two-component system sensor histidine kinase PilS (NtrC family)